MDIEVLERLMEQENEEVSLRYILKYSMREGSNIFQLFVITAEKKDHFVTSRRRWLESSDVEASERTSRSGCVRDQRFGHQVAVSAHLDI